MAELERESLAKLAELETELGAIKVEYSEALEARRLVEEELTALKRQRQDSARRQSVLENKIIELETLTGTLTKGSSGILRSKFEVYICVNSRRYEVRFCANACSIFQLLVYEMAPRQVLWVIRITLHPRCSPRHRHTRRFRSLLHHHLHPRHRVRRRLLWHLSPWEIINYHRLSRYLHHLLAWCKRPMEQWLLNEKYVFHWSSTFSKNIDYKYNIKHSKVEWNY